MKKLTSKLRLRLQKDTLRALAEIQLAAAAGGNSQAGGRTCYAQGMGGAGASTYVVSLKQCGDTWNAC